MRRCAVVICFSFCNLAAHTGSAADQGYAASSTYRAPARWNNFKRPSTPIPSTTHSARIAAVQRPVESLPAPGAEAISPIPQVRAVERSLAQPPVPVNTQPYAQPNAPTVDAMGTAAEASWDGDSCETCQPAVVAGPRPIAPWFGGMSLLFWNTTCSNDIPLISNDVGGVALQNGDLDPSSTVGFDVHFGRYLACGRYGLDFGYMFWDPGTVSTIVPDAGAGLRVPIPALTTISINRGAGATTVYDEFDLNSPRIRATRDLRIQGFEVNLNCFGLSGARRLGSCSPSGLCGNPLGKLACHRRRAYGGLLGPLARACSGNVRVQTSHGLRWFQLEDDLQIAGNVDGVAGYGPDDIYYDLQTENNLFGYQFGGQLAYCLGCRTMLTIGSKMGMYGNDARFTQRIGTNSILAYTNSQGAGAGDVSTSQSKVCLAGLGELDFGLGYRLSNRWTINSGYRILAVTGVATGIGQSPTQYTTAASAGAVRANDSLVLHGAYVGMDYNW